MNRTKALAGLLLVGLAVAAAMGVQGFAANGSPPPAVAAEEEEEEEEEAEMAQPPGRPSISFGMLKRSFTVESQEPQESPELVQKIYDVRSLLRIQREFKFAHLYQMEPVQTEWYPTSFNLFEQRDDRKMTFEQFLQQQLKETVEQITPLENPWDNYGGSSTIHFLPGGRMVVKAIPADQERVAETVAMLKASNWKTLTISIQAVELKGDLAEQVLSGKKTQFATAEEQQALTEGSGRTYACHLLTGLEGQTLSVNTGTSQMLIERQEPVVAEGTLGFDTETHSALDGLAAQVAARSAEGNQALFDYQLCFARLVSTAKVKVAATGQVGEVRMMVAEAQTDLPQVLLDQHAGSITMRLGVPTVVAAGKVPAALVDPSLDPDDPATVLIGYLVTVREMAQK